MQNNIKKNTVKKISFTKLLVALIAIIAINHQQMNAQIVDSTINSIISTFDALKKIKLSGFIQAQYNNGQEDGMKSYSGGNFPANSHNMFKLRRGRLTAAYTDDMLKYTFQINVGETGLSVLDVWAEVTDPFIKTFSLRGGIFKAPMTTEILQSTSSRFNIESSRMLQVLLPGDFDLGGMITIQAPKGHILNPLSLTMSILGGNGIHSETDNYKDKTARLLYSDNFGNFKLTVGEAVYFGGVSQMSPEVYKMDGNKFVLNSSDTNIGKQATRAYYASEIKLGYRWGNYGETVLSGEYWFGEQAGTNASSTSPNASTLPIGPTYIRPFNGIIGMLAHTITPINLTIVGRYDVYDPNTNISQNEVGLNGTNATDLMYSTIGGGLLYEPVKNLRFTLWYDYVMNEKTESITNYLDDIKDNMLTFRMQVSF